MALNELPLAEGGIYRDFEAHVLEDLIKYNATMHGCPVSRVECKLDGGVAVWFKGPRDGALWEGALRFNYQLLSQKKWLGDVNALVETTLKLLEQVSLKTGQKLVERAVN